MAINAINTGKPHISPATILGSMDSGAANAPELNAVTGGWLIELEGVMSTSMSDSGADKAAVLFGSEGS